MRDPLDTLTHLVETTPVASHLDASDVRRRGDRRRHRRAAAVVAAGLVLVAGGAVLVANPKHDAHPQPVKQVKVAKVLGPDGYGALKLGMTVVQAKATGLVEIVGKADAGETCVGFRIVGQPLPKNQVAGYVSRKHGVVAVFAGTGVETAEGIRNGSTEAEARVAYPHARSEVNGWFDRLSPAGAQPEVDYRFSFTAGKVTDLFVQRSDQDCYE